jgi:hypothetical protein
MKSWIMMVVLLAGFGFGCGQRQTGAPGSTNTPAAGANPLTAPVDYIGAVGQAQRVAEKTTITVSVDKAVQAFYAGEDRFPTNLNELVTQQYLPVLPPPPRGTLYDYNPASGQVSLRPAPAAPSQPAR